MIQCKDNIVILRRSEDRRRICNLSPNRSFAYAQNDKVGLGFGRSCGARPATAGCLRACAGQGCGPHGSNEPHDASASIAKTIVPHPPPHSFERLLFAPAAGYRRREDGYLGGIGTNGGYWSSSTLGSTDPSRAGNWNFSADNVNPLGGDARTTGRPVRCVQASARRLFRRGGGRGGRRGKSAVQPVFGLLRCRCGQPCLLPG